MPAIKKGESRKDYLKRCIPYVMKKEGLSRKAASGKCNGMYDQHKKKGTNYMILPNKRDGEEHEFMFNCPVVEFKFDSDGKFDFSEGKGYNVVIMIANRFMNGIYMSREMTKGVYKGFNNTPHDINHMGTGYQAGFAVIPSNIEYVVGYQDDLQYDNASGEVRATVHVDDKSPKYDAWESYVRICESMGRTPNVSMFVKGKIEWIEARKLPKDSHYGRNGYKAEDLVPCMTITETVAVSTVFTGSCDDKDGCGIKHSQDESPPKTWDVEVEKIQVSNEEDIKKINNMKRLNKLRGKKYDR